MKSILVASDLSARSDRALRRGFALARAHGARLQALHVVDEELPSAIAGLMAEAARDELDRFCRALPEAEATAWAARVDIGDPAPDILAAAEECGADLVVLGLHRGRVPPDLFGDTTLERIARASLRPLLLAAGPPDRPYASALIGLDLSPASAAAARAARELAPEARATAFHAVHVPCRALSAGTGGRAVSPFMAQAGRDLKAWLRETGLARALPAPELREGAAPAVFEALMQETRPDIVALGAHGRGALSPALLGGFAADLVRDPPCDLLVVRR